MAAGSSTSCARATIFSILTSSELLPELSVFAGTFTVTDARAVASAGGRAALAPVIRGLVDSSWLVVTPGQEHNRFGMLETLRSFAAARLD